jgi:DNA primase
MRQLGFTNTLSILGSKISKEQIELLKELGVIRVNLFLDNDKAGFDGMEKAYKLMKKDFVLYKVQYPEGKNDPQELKVEEVKSMLSSRTMYGRKLLQKLA